MATDVVMPQLGESVVEGVVTKWLVKQGDRVRQDQAVVEVATDKADSEVPSPCAGVVSKILVGEGSIAKIGVALCVLETEDSLGLAREGSSHEASDVLDGKAPVAASTDVAKNGQKAPTRSFFQESFASPAVRRLAREHGIDIRELEGSGEHGRVTRDDVLRNAGLDPEKLRAPRLNVEDPPPIPFGPPLPRKIPVDDPVGQNLSHDRQELASLIQSAGGLSFPRSGIGYGAYKVPPYVPREGDTVIPFSRRRRLTADHMVYSKTVAPHVVTVAEIDLFATMRLRDKVRDSYSREAIALTALPFVCVAVAAALREHPEMNARVLDDSYVLLQDINLGIAVDAPGGLIVPNVKRADELSVRGMARAIDELSTKARDGKISADDLLGTSFSVSNPGRKGNLFGGAIISQPASAILRTGEIKKRVVVVESEAGDTIAIHPVMYAALSYDHRIIDGALANSFLWRVSEILSKGELRV